MPKLSVIVPFHNVRPHAPDTLRSLRLNARPDFEFLLVDDHSQDGTQDILERAAEDLSAVARVRHFRHDGNRGVSAARNTGLDAARGEFLVFLDGGDWLAPGHLARLVADAEELGCDFVRTDQVQVTGRARSVRRVPVGLRGEVLNPRDAILPADRTTSVDYVYVWAGIYRRRLLERGLLHFDEGLRTAEDRPWAWRLHREAESFAVTDLLGVFYRRGVSSSLSRIGDARQLDFIRAFDQILEETSADRDAGLLLPKAVRTYCAVVAHHLAERDKFEPAVARKLRTMSAAALRRMPQDVLDDVLDTMDLRRSARLRRLRRPGRRAGTGKDAA
ncbi:glycosyltransferase [Streptomyces sp. NPDC088106]|uniref:glycosyltransferase n=1 Tax=unclassified Streptomyces TaxID=2593676 RepID=UPI00342EF0BA